MNLDAFDFCISWTAEIKWSDIWKENDDNEYCLWKEMQWSEEDDEWWWKMMSDEKDEFSQKKKLCVQKIISSNFKNYFIRERQIIFDLNIIKSFQIFFINAIQYQSAYSSNQWASLHNVWCHNHKENRLKLFIQDNSLLLKSIIDKLQKLSFTQNLTCFIIFTRSTSHKNSTFMFTWSRRCSSFIHKLCAESSAFNVFFMKRI
jgi:hypothetical protein